MGSLDTPLGRFSTSNIRDSRIISLDLEGIMGMLTVRGCVELAIIG
jgi:hypothetical protein